MRAQVLERDADDELELSAGTHVGRDFGERVSHLALSKAERAQREKRLALDLGGSSTDATAIGSAVGV